MPSYIILRCGDYIKFLMGLRKNSTKICAQLHVFFAVETNLSFWRDLEKFSQKSVPCYIILRCGDHIKFLMGLRKSSTKICAQLHVFSLWRLTWVFDGTWKNFHKKVCPVTRFYAVETILNFWWDLESFDKKVWPFTRFFAVETNLSFWRDLEKFSQKSVPSYISLRCGDYIKFLMGLRKNSTKICAQLHVFFAVETNLSFWRDLEKFSQKSVPCYIILRCGDHLKFLMGLRKIFTKICAQLHVFSLWRLTWVFDGTWKNFHKKVCPVI